MMTFDEKQLNTNYVLKLNKRTHEFITNYGDASLTNEQQYFISSYYLNNEMKSDGGSMSPLCEGYYLLSKKLGNNMFMFKITLS